MGNAQSDEGEAEAYRIIKYIPGVNIGYSAARACVYKGRADNEVRDKLLPSPRFPFSSTIRPKDLTMHLVQPGRATPTPARG
jgi:hypothetical protein